MKLYNQLKLHFDTSIWGLHTELALFDILLDKNPYFVTLVSDDVLSEVKESSFGRKSYSVIQKYILKISEKSIRSIILTINRFILYTSDQPIVGEPVRLVASERVINRQVGSDEVFKLAINVAKNTTFFKPNKSYYFRVGAVTSVPVIKFNYAPAELIEIGEIVPEPEPEGTKLDDCESIDGWTGGDSGPVLDWDNPQEGSYAIKFNSGGGFIIQKNFNPPVDSKVSREYGVLQFDLYIYIYQTFHYSIGIGLVKLK